MTGHRINVKMKDGRTKQYRPVLFRVDLRDQEGEPVQLSILRDDDIVNLAGPGPHDFLGGYIFDREVPA